MNVAMKCFVMSLLLWMATTSAYAQDHLLEVGSSRISIENLNLSDKQQLEKDLAIIQRDPELQAKYNSQSQRLFNTFSGTEEEKTKLLLKIAHRLAEQPSTNPTAGPAGNSLSPRVPSTGSTGQDISSITGVRTIKRSVKVNSGEMMQDAIAARPNPTDIDRGGQLHYEDNKGNGLPAPMNPGRQGPMNYFHGQISYEIPDTMREGEPEFVRLVVAVDPAVAEQLAKRDVGELNSEEIGIGRHMKAELVDLNSFNDEDQNFQIKIWEGELIQSFSPVDPSSAIVWEWAVRPVQPGRHTLGVKVSIILYDDRLPNKKEYRSIDTYSQPIQILTKPKVRKGQLKPLHLALGGIVLVLVLGVLAFFLSRRSRSRALARLREVPHVAEGDGLADATQIESLIRAGDFDRAASELLEFASLRQYPERSSILAIQARIQHWKSDIHHNIIDGDEARQERSRITLALIHLLEEVQKE